MIAPDLIVQGIGSQTIGAAGVFNLSFAYIWSADICIFLLAMVANGLKLIQNMDRRSGALSDEPAFLHGPDHGRGPVQWAVAGH